MFRLFIGVYKAVLLKSRYCPDPVTGFLIKLSLMVCKSCRKQN
nr:MAG TPA: Late embryogenesis abundant protein [Caudoviricetes sp.]